MSSALAPSITTPRHPSNWPLISSQVASTASRGPMILATGRAPLPTKRSVSLPGSPAPHSTRLAPSRGEIFTAPRPGIARRMRQATVVLPHPLPVPTTAIIFTLPPAAPAAAAVRFMILWRHHHMRSNANHHEPTLDFGLPAAYADIALRLALPGSLQFGIPESLRGSLRVGQRVMVPLRGGRDVGYVVGLSNEPKVRGIRPIERVLDPEPHLPPDLLELMLWIAHHYLSPIGMVLRAAVPQAVHYEGTSKAVARERQILTAALTVPADEAEALLPDLARRAPAQAEALAGLCRAQGKPVPASSLNRAALEGLQKKGLVTLGSTGSRRGILPPLETSVEPAPLTPAQTAVFSQILPALAGGGKAAAGAGRHRQRQDRALPARDPRPAARPAGPAARPRGLADHPADPPPARAAPLPDRGLAPPALGRREVRPLARDPPRRGAHGRRHALGALRAPAPARAHRGRRGAGGLLQAGGDPLLPRPGRGHRPRGATAAPR